MESTTASNEEKEISSILEDIEITPFFQPIICIKTGKVFAYESLVRGRSKATGALVSPAELFALTDSKALTREFDQLCQQLSLKYFKKYKSNSLLFMNIHTNCIMQETTDSLMLPNLTEQMGFNPNVIGLEFIESKAHSAHELIGFVRQQRESGFLIVVDDFGSEHSNIERLILIHPDIIKIDRNIIHGIDKDTYLQSILKSIVSLSEMTGSVCLAEGVETKEEVLTCALLGVNLLQGFAIARPAADLLALEQEALQKMAEFQRELRQHSVSYLRETRYHTSDVNTIADWLIRQIDIENDDMDSIEAVLQEFVIVNSKIELIFILDEDGIQVSNMICAPHIANKPNSYIFHVQEKGGNHCLRPYFTCFEAFKIDRFLTDKHLSSGSGNLCRTLAVRLPGKNKFYILCIDFLEEEIKTPLKPIEE